MFEVCEKEFGEKYMVYDVITDHGFPKFLIYKNGRWDYYYSGDYFPYKEQ